MDNPSAATTRFSEMAQVHPHTERALSKAGITHAFPIQQVVIPLAAEGDDLLVKSPTGSGKTLAFGLPIIHQLERGCTRPEALIMVPTRELAVQVSQDLVPPAWTKQLRCAPVFGGAAVSKQVKHASRSAIIVATPGRLADLVREQRISLTHVRILVLDEADRMLDMGFQPQVDELVAKLPNVEQTMFFSATLDGAVGKLAAKYTTDAHTIENVAAPGAGGEIDHVMMATTAQTRVETLLSQLLDVPRDLSLVFVSTQRMAEGLKEHLRTFGLRTTAIHGGMKQRERLREYKLFKSGAVDVLIATDIFSRGMDNDRITHVINYELPEDSDAYRHRVGRTGRAGRSGTAITLIEPGMQVAKMRQIIQDVGLPQSLIDTLQPPALRHYAQVPVAQRYTDPPEEREERHSTRNHRRALARSGAPLNEPDTRPIDFGRSLPQVQERPTMKKLMASAKQQHTHVRAGAAGVGTIIGYNDDKGFGFIKPAAGGKEIFFHRSTVAGSKMGLKKGASVKFTLGRADKKGHSAQTVKVVRSAKAKR